MNTHPFDPETIMAFLDGELPAAHAARCAEHLVACTDCSNIADKFRTLSASLGKWKVEGFRADQAVLKNLKVRASGQSWRARPFFRVLVPTAVVGALCLLVLALAIPNLLKSRMAANEASVAGSLRTLTTATIMYHDQYHHLPPSLASLAGPTHGAPHADAADLIDQTLASGTKSGYRFTYQPFGDRYTITAEALDPSIGIRSFSTDETGVIFADGKPLDGTLPAQKLAASQIAEALQHQRPVLIARTVELSVVVKDFASARTSLDAVLLRHRGYAAQLTVSGDPSARGSIQASLRIPVPELDSALAELKSFGRVERESQSGEEVTMQHADLIARISNSREAEARLKDILRTRTGKVSDVLEVEQRISQTRGQIEQMEAELKTVENRVDFASVSLSLSTEFKDKVGELSPAAGTRLHNAFVSGFRDARESFLSLLVWLLSTGPEIILWVIILAFPTFLIWRRRRNLQSRALAA
jgi:Domain of unknown function (DUF4349)/Putative zinc-finger